MKTAKVEVGRFICNQVRNFLLESQFCGQKFDWIELPGFVSNEFVLRSSDDTAVRIVGIMLEQFKKSGIKVTILDTLCINDQEKCNDSKV
jgi:hypothetical protein